MARGKRQPPNSTPVHTTAGSRARHPGSRKLGYNPKREKYLFPNKVSGRMGLQVGCMYSGNTSPWPNSSAVSESVSTGFDPGGAKFLEQRRDATWHTLTCETWLSSRGCPRSRACRENVSQTHLTRIHSPTSFKCGIIDFREDAGVLQGNPCHGTLSAPGQIGPPRPAAGH